VNANIFPPVSVLQTLNIEGSKLEGGCHRSPTLHIEVDAQVLHSKVASVGVSMVSMQNIT